MPSMVQISTDEEVRSALQAELDKVGGVQTTLANKVGVRPNYISIGLAQIRNINSDLLEYLGFTRQSFFVAKPKRGKGGDKAQ